MSSTLFLHLRSMRADEEGMMLSRSGKVRRDDQNVNFKQTVKDD